MLPHSFQGWIAALDFTSFGAASIALFAVEAKLRGKAGLGRLFTIHIAVFNLAFRRTEVRLVPLCAPGIPGCAD